MLKIIVLYFIVVIPLAIIVGKCLKKLSQVPKITNQRRK